MRRLFLSAAMIGVLAVGGCGVNSTDAVSLAADSSPEAQTLVGMGVNPALLAADTSASPSASASASGAHPGKLRRIRVELRKKMLHGEATVQTKNGTETIAGQRGTVTAVTSTTVTVKSTDGFTETWTFGSPIRVVRDKKAGQVGDVKTGVQIAVAGPKTDGTYDARLIVLG
jgi:hypothetical protein